MNKIIFLLLLSSGLSAQYIEPIDSLPLTPPIGRTTYERPEIALPTLMTPNGDGLNDVLYIENLTEYDVRELKIWNRWGTPVYQSDDYQNDWDGGNVSDGVYFYELYVRNQQVMGSCYGTLTIIENE